MRRRNRSLNDPDLDLPAPGTSRVRPDKPMPSKAQVPDGWSSTSGTIRETCSCGASIETPATRDSCETLADWRHMHRHIPARQPEESKSDEPEHHSLATDTAPATGEVRESYSSFGFSPPVVEASKPKPWSKPKITTVEKPGAKPKPMPPEPKGDPK